jgi:hypothetical protein
MLRMEAMVYAGCRQSVGSTDTSSPPARLNVSHFAPLQPPAEFNRALLAFLATLM